MEVAALVISLIAIVVSGASAYYTKAQSDAAKDQARSSNQLLAIEEARRQQEVVQERAKGEASRTATLHLRPDPHPERSGFRLRLSNDGAAAASNIELTWLRSLDGKGLPASIPAVPMLLRGGETANLDLTVWAEMSEHFLAQVAWTDLRGKHISHEEIRLG